MPLLFQRGHKNAIQGYDDLFVQYNHGIYFDVWQLPRQVTPFDVMVTNLYDVIMAHIFMNDSYQESDPICCYGDHLV